MKTKCLLIILFINSCIAGAAMSQSFSSFNANSSCGVAEKLTQAERQAQAQLFRNWRNNSTLKTTNGRTASIKYTIPIVFHLIERGPNIRDFQIATLVSSLNNAFSHSQNDPAGDDYSQEANEGDTLGVDTEIEFCLAQKAPDGGVTTGITRITSEYYRFDMDLENFKLKTMEQWDPRHYLNVWLVEDIDAEIIIQYSGREWWTRYGAGGYATVPGAVIRLEDLADGIVMDATNLSSGLLAHETGHYLGLHHTFGTDFIADCKNDNCLEEGDFVCDTPPDMSFFKPCEDNSCATDTLSNYSNNTFFEDVLDMSSNFMDYSDCTTRAFTKGQSERMYFHLEQFRINLFSENPSNNTACTLPCNADISISFTQDDPRPIPNRLVNFESDATGVTDYEWYVDSLGDVTAGYSIAWETGYIPSTPVVATTPNLSHTFPEQGKYRVYLKTWDTTDPSCFTSYSRIVRVTCGVDARFWPNKRTIAAKQPQALFQDTVTFKNRSRGALSYKWTMTHTNLITGGPNLPVVNSTETDFVYIFAEPGVYRITLTAINGSCVDVSNTFALLVLDPTIDGIPSLSNIECFNGDSIRMNLKITNVGFDTINVGTPVSFYDKDPRLADPLPKLLKTYNLPGIVYGFDSAVFTLFVKNTQPKLEQLYVVFNDPGTTTFPVQFPEGDKDILSFNSVSPSSGYTELTYDNNFIGVTDFEFNRDLLPDIWACEREVLEFDVGDFWRSVQWRSSNQGDLSDSSSLTYEVDQADTINVQLTSIQGCISEDTFFINVSEPELTLNGEVFRILKGNSVQLTAGGGTSYEWTPAEGLNDHLISNPLASPERTTTYTIEVMDSIGCTTTGTVQIIVESNAFVPNLFTPNEDQRNDVLRIYGLEEVNDFIFKIYNRSASLVFSSSNLNEVVDQGWDGTKNGKEQPNGVYYWEISGTYKNGNTVYLNGESSGAVHLLR